MSIKQILFCAVIIGPLIMNEKANAGTDFMRTLVDQAQTAVSNPTTKESIPDYSEAKKNEIAAQHNSIDSSQLEQAGSNNRDREINSDPNCAAATIANASSLKRLENTENYNQLDMFTRGDKIMRDPIVSMDELTDKKCKELTHSKKKGYHTREIVETKQEQLSGEMYCSIGGLKLECNKALKLKCERTVECNAGGIVLENFEGDMLWEYNYPILALGSKGIFPKYGECEKRTRQVKFEIKNKELIDEFILIRTTFGDHLRILLNGIQVYNSMSGNGSFEIEVDPYRPGYYNQYNRVYSGSVTGICNTGGFYQYQLTQDLRGYLKNGINILDVELLFGNRGQLYFEISTKQHCCSSWHEDWVTTCEPFAGSIVRSVNPTTQKAVK